MFLTAKCQVLIKFNVKNSKVFEQKGNLLNFKANIDPMAMLSAKSSQAEPSQKLLRFRLFKQVFKVLD